MILANLGRINCKIYVHTQNLNVRAIFSFEKEFYGIIFGRKEDCTMKNKLQKKTVKVLAAVSKKMAEINANSACVYWMHQPKMPEAVKKLRKF